MTAATSFEKDIKPYFSQSERDAMIDPNHTGGFVLDLWSRDDVEKNYDDIKGTIDIKAMPPGGWADDKIAAFDKDFENWKSGGYQP
jgi:hypothetical protein